MFSESADLYYLISRFTYPFAGAFLKRKRGTVDPSGLNSAVTLSVVMAATARCVARIEHGMSHAMRGVSKDLLAFDVLAFTTVTLQQAMRARLRQRGTEHVENACVQLSVMGHHIREQVIDRHAPSLGPLWVERWKEYREIEAPGERFGRLAYLLYASAGHPPPRRWALPLFLDLTLAREAKPTEKACLHEVLQAADVLERLCSHMSPEDECDEGNLARAEPNPR